MKRKTLPETFDAPKIVNGAFASEVDLCKQFLLSVKDDWQPYAETEGWDILLVRKSDGCQIGIEAKLRINTHVLSQALEDGSWHAVRPGPDFRAILVPFGKHHPIELICTHLGITVIKQQVPREVNRLRGLRWSTFHPTLPNEMHPLTYQGNDWFDRCTPKRHPLPEYIPDVKAGSAAPVQLTAWKIAAIKIMVTLELRGYVVRADFKHHGINYARWIAPGFQWLLSGPDKKLIAGAHAPDFRKQHPKVYEQIKAEAQKWMPSVEKLHAKIR